MKKRAVIALVFSLVGTLSFAQEPFEYSFSLLRQDDKITGKPSDPNFYQSLKRLPLGETSFLSIGGSYRGQYELFKNLGFVEAQQPERGWYLQRLFLHTNLQLGKRLQIFGELASSLIYGKPDLSPVDKNELYFNQFLARYRVNNWEVALGRENLKLGSRRLVDIREGPNVRRAFDKVSIGYQQNNTSYYAFAGIPVIPKPGIFDDDILNDQEVLWGFYWSRFNNPTFKFDLYYLGIHYDQNEYERGIEEETRHSLGFRAWRNLGKFIFDNEAVIQFGQFGESSILAYTLSVNASAQVAKAQRLGVKTELISGDRDSTDNRLGTFNAMYPRGAYFGRVAQLGPANLIDIHPYWNITMGKFFMEIDYDFFWRYSVQDAIYDPALNIVTTGPSDSRFIAHQLGFMANYEVNAFMMAEFETSYIMVGDFIKDTVDDPRNLFHMVVTVEVRF